MDHVQSMAIIIFVIGFAIYRRIRRTVGSQPLKIKRLRVRIIIFLVIGLIFLVSGVMHPISLISDLVGCVIGAVLAYYGAGLTRYEQRDNTWYFQPNPWIGGVVVVLFLGRFLYRFYEMYSLGLLNGTGSTSESSLHQMNMLSGTSWTSGLLLIMFAYYIVYFILLMRKEKELNGSIEA